MPTKTAHKAVDRDLERTLAGLQIVAIAEIADRLGVARETVEKWKERSEQYRDSDQPEWAFPEPRWSVAHGRTSLWLFDVDIMPWVIETGREHYLEGKQRADDK